MNTKCIYDLIADDEKCTVREELNQVTHLTSLEYYQLLVGFCAFCKLRES